MTGDWRDPGEFDAQLRWFVLDAYARDEPLEGQWILADTDALIPDLIVVVERVDAEEWRAGRADTTDFKARLQSFLLGAFADGVDVVGQWEVRFPTPELPSWRVRIATADRECARSNDQRNAEF